jgi:lysophospholipid acyltransferase (LPLAT)-like uncharacterized protein
MANDSPASGQEGTHNVQSTTTRRRRFKKSIRRFFLTLALATLPRMYMAWMWFVFRTSRVETIGLDIEELRPAYGGAVGALWHDEVVTVAYAFRRFHGHTLASTGDFGELIARLLRLCNFTVFRGGSSSGRSRRSTDVLDDMIRCMNETPNVIYGITVDGSNGPPYRVKKGACVVATRCQKPIFTERTWFRSYLRLPSWDRTLVPMPFNRIVHGFAGPFLPPPVNSGEEALEEFRARIESELLELTYYVRGLIEETPLADRTRNYPDGWQPSWGSSPRLVRPFAPMPATPIDTPLASPGETGHADGLS